MVITDVLSDHFSSSFSSVSRHAMASYRDAFVDCDVAVVSDVECDIAFVECDVAVVECDVAFVDCNVAVVDCDVAVVECDVD